MRTIVRIGQHLHLARLTVGAIILQFYHEETRAPWMISAVRISQKPCQDMGVDSAADS
jgi:hypothetical protein